MGQQGGMNAYLNCLVYPWVAHYNGMKSVPRYGTLKIRARFCSLSLSSLLLFTLLILLVLTHRHSASYDSPSNNLTRYV